MTDPNLWNQLLIWPIVNVLILFYKGFLQLGVGGAFGFAVLGLTILVRVVLWPLSGSALKNTQKMVELRPHLERIRKQHGHDRVRHLQEQQKLYKQHGISPAAGCLPLLLQLPIFIALYNVFFSVLSANQDLSTVTGQINQIVYSPSLELSQTIDLTFFGVNLAAKPADWQQLGVWALAIPVLTALLQFFQSKMMMPKAVSEYKSDTPKEKKEKQTTEEMMLEMQKQMLFLMPLMFGFFAFQLPVGLALYWNTFTVFGMIQQYRITAWGGLEEWINKLLKKQKN